MRARLPDDSYNRRERQFIFQRDWVLTGVRLATENMPVSASVLRCTLVARNQEFSTVLRRLQHGFAPLLRCL